MLNSCCDIFLNVAMEYIKKLQSSGPPQITERLRTIASDNKSGAVEILVRAADVFALLDTAAVRKQMLDTEQARRLIIEICIALIRAQPCMAPLANLASTVAAAANVHPGEEIIR